MSKSGGRKAERGRDLHVIGSPGLVRSLLAQGLVDELQLMIDPVLVGGASDHRDLRRCAGSGLCTSSP